MLKGGFFLLPPSSTIKACLLNLTLKETCPSEPKEVYHQCCPYNQSFANLIVLNKLPGENLKQKNYHLFPKEKKSVTVKRQLVEAINEMQALYWI